MPRVILRTVEPANELACQSVENRCTRNEGLLPDIGHRLQRERYDGLEADKPQHHRQHAERDDRAEREHRRVARGRVRRRQQSRIDQMAGIDRHEQVGGGRTEESGRDGRGAERLLQPVRNTNGSTIRIAEGLVRLKRSWHIPATALSAPAGLHLKQRADGIRPRASWRNNRVTCCFRWSRRRGQSVAGMCHDRSDDQALRIRIVLPFVFPPLAGATAPRLGVTGPDSSVRPPPTCSLPVYSGHLVDALTAGASEPGRAPRGDARVRRDRRARRAVGDAAACRPPTIVPFTLKTMSDVGQQALHARAAILDRLARQLVCRLHRAQDLTRGMWGARLLNDTILMALFAVAGVWSAR